jgi:class 3 adenylate cyclase
MAEPPTGTVTFLFTDIEGSTRLWEEHPEPMRAAIANHDEILRDAVESHEGVVFSTMGDGIAAACVSAPKRPTWLETQPNGQSKPDRDFRATASRFVS